MSKFTKGKWEYVQAFGVVYSEDTSAIIASVCDAGTESSFSCTPEGQANARLIAAAPEMYRLLDDARGIITQLDVGDPLALEIELFLASIDVEDGEEEEHDY